MSERYIDDIFKQTLENHEVSPPFSNWDKIQSQLPQKRAFYQRKSFKGSMFALLLLMSGLGWYITSHLPQPAKQLQQETTQHAANLPIAQSDNAAALSTATQQNTNAQVTQQFEQNNPIQQQTNQSAGKTTQNQVQAQATLVNTANGNSLAAGAGIYTKTLKSQTANTSSTKNRPITQNSTLATPNYQIGGNDDNGKLPDTPQSAQTNNPDLTNINLPKLAQNTLQSKQNATFAPENEHNVTNSVEQTALPIVANTSENAQKSNTETEQKDGVRNNVINAVAFIGKPRKDKTNGFYFGSFYGMHISRLLNNQALSATQSIEEVNFSPHKGNHYGFSTGYNFNEHWGLQAEWVVKSAQGQMISYRPKESVSFQYTEVNLNYMQVPILAKYRINRTSVITRHPAVINFLAGIQYGVLQSAEINLNNPFMHNNLLKKTQWGMALGFDYDLYLTKNYFLTFGARGSFATSSDGFTHIELPNQNTANHLALGLRAALSYRFKR